MIIHLKNEAKKDVNENSQKVDEDFAVHIMKCIREIEDSGIYMNSGTFLPNPFSNNLDKFVYPSKNIKEISEAMIRVIIQGGISFINNSQTNPLPFIISNYIQGKTYNQYQIVPEHTQNFAECVNTIINSIDSKMPIIGSFFYGYDDYKKKGWHAMNIIGYVKIENESEVIGFLVVNPWPTTQIDGENINIGYFSYKNLKSCMWKGFYETIRFIRN